MSFIRQILYGLWFYLSIAAFGILAAPMAAFSRKATMAAIRGWATAQQIGVRLICGVTTEVRGLENLPDGGCVVAMKHQSTYDTVAPFAFLPAAAYVLKQELLKQPIFGWYAKRAGMVAIDREGGAKTMRHLIAEAKRCAQEKRQIVIFPEGTRQEVGAPPDYKPGVMGLYKAAGLPCVPVAVNTGLYWPGKTFPGRPGRIVFEILPAIQPGLSRDDFMTHLQEAIEPATARLVEETQPK